MADLRANFEGECSEVGMYLAMARVAHREGYPEVGLYYEKAAYEEAEHCLLYTSVFILIFLIFIKCLECPIGIQHIQLGSQLKWRMHGQDRHS